MTRQFNIQLNNMVDNMVKVHIGDEKYFVGQLKGISESSSLILTNAKNEKGQKFPKLYIQSAYYNFVSLEEEPFPMEALAKRIGKVFPKGHVKYLDEQNVISILNGKIRVDEDGVRGSGPSAERVKKIFEQFKLDIESE
ncbi:MAG: Lsm family RNA-binding protein [Promethearchaeia archaeon]